MNEMNPAKPFDKLTQMGLLTDQILAEAARNASNRRLHLSTVLHYEYGIPRPILLEILADHYQCATIEYDEWLPIAPELLARLPAARLSETGWFPVLKYNDGHVVIAAWDPADPALAVEAEKYLGPGQYEYRVALPEDILWFIQDFLYAPVGKLVGTERTGLAFWRNTMGQWRTMLACFRTDMARARTALSVARCWFTLVTVAFTLLRSNKILTHSPLFILLLAIGTAMGALGIPMYLQVTLFKLRPPGHQTLVEVTAATLIFLENFHFLSGLKTGKPRTKDTMLARLGDFLADYCTILYPPPGSRERTRLARERNVLAAQRTIAACYRTTYARARTGLSFIRTGVPFMSFGIGLITYYGFGPGNIFDGILIGMGLLMAIDGIFWYMPFRREQAELPQTRSGALAG